MVRGVGGAESLVLCVSEPEDDSMFDTPGVEMGSGGTSSWLWVGASSLGGDGRSIKVFLPLASPLPAPLPLPFPVPWPLAIFGVIKSPPVAGSWAYYLQGTR